MTQQIKRVGITVKEGEALMWGLGQIVNWPDREPEGPTDPLQVLLSAGHSRVAVMETAEALFPTAYGDWISEPLSALEKDILRVCVENSTWMHPYRSGAPTRNDPGLINEALTTLRSLAKKLEVFGIEVNHIPFD